MRRMIVVCLALFVVSAAATALPGDGPNLITFRNDSSGTVDYIFLSPGDSEHWGPDILGAYRILGGGESIGFYVLHPDDCNTYDIMAVGADGAAVIIHDFLVCRGMEGVVEIGDDDFTAETPEMEFVTVSIRNDVLPIYYLFISPADSAYRGVDYLDESTIMDTGDEVSLLFPATDVATTFYVLGIDEDGGEYEFSFDVDIDSDGGQFTIELDDMR